MKTTFKNLAVGDKFKFNHDGLPFMDDLGPFVKVSARKYALLISSSGRSLAHYQVGRISVEVDKI